MHKRARSENKKKSQWVTELLEWRGAHVHQKVCIPANMIKRGWVRLLNKRRETSRECEGKSNLCFVRFWKIQIKKRICCKWEKQRGESVRSEKCPNSSSWPVFYPDPDISLIFTSSALLPRVVLSSSLGCLQHFHLLAGKLDVKGY